MATVQVRVDDDLKARADKLWASLGIDTSTAVRMFLVASLERHGLPFEVRHDPMSLFAAMDDAMTLNNLYGPFDTAREAVAAMLEDDDDA